MANENVKSMIDSLVDGDNVAAQDLSLIHI